MQAAYVTLNQFLSYQFYHIYIFSWYESCQDFASIELVFVFPLKIAIRDVTLSGITRKDETLVIQEIYNYNFQIYF